MVYDMLLYDNNTSKSSVKSYSKQKISRCKKGLMAVHHNSSHHRHHNTHPQYMTSSKSSLSVMSTRKLIAFISCLWITINLYQQCSTQDVHQNYKHIIYRPQPSTYNMMVDAFSNDVLSRRYVQRQHRYCFTTSRQQSLAAKRSYTLLSFVPQKQQTIDIPHRNNQLIFNRRFSIPSPPASCKSLTLLQSTISDETATATMIENSINGENLNGNHINNVVNGIENKMGEVNGHSKMVNGYSTVNMNGFDASSQHAQLENETESLLDDDDDKPKPTVNGGFTHTTSSRAKISAANKGKTPWNKGKARSDETKARIAEGVRRRNRERFLAKLNEEGITEEEYNERKKAERRAKDAERRARRTVKGGYTPTEATKQKISKVLKEKYANGEVKKRKRDPTKVRRGFKHTEETKAKIRESLKRKWAEDIEYRELMTNKTIASGNVGKSVRKRISETLKKKWEDPNFRASMMEKFKNRKFRSGERAESHRQKISIAMKRKWRDEEYRKRATAGMAKGREGVSKGKGITAVKPVQPRTSSGGNAVNGGGVQPMQPMQPLPPVASRAAASVEMKQQTTVKKKKKKKTSTVKQRSKTPSNKSSINKQIDAVKPIQSSSTTTAAAASTRTSSSSTKSPSDENAEQKEDEDGSISRLREERRDLYDLLYGDEEEDDDEEDYGTTTSKNDQNNNVQGQRIIKGKVLTANGSVRESSHPRISSTGSTGKRPTMELLSLEDDDDLDDFDPYGLQT